MTKDKQIIKQAILDIPLVSASMVVEEKGLLFRLNPDFVDSLVNVVLDIQSQTKKELMEKMIKKVWDLDNPFTHDYEPKSNKQYDPNAWHDWEYCKEKVVESLETESK